jgi:hypothetical protein
MIFWLSIEKAVFSIPRMGKVPGGVVGIHKGFYSTLHYINPLLYIYYITFWACKPNAVIGMLLAAAKRRVTWGHPKTPRQGAVALETLLSFALSVTIAGHGDARVSGHAWYCGHAGHGSGCKVCSAIGAKYPA